MKQKEVSPEKQVAGKLTGTVANDLVSVIIPCYNQASFLAEAINSVLVQTHAHTEILVIDDGSPDNIAEVTGSYPQVTLVKQANGGAALARNNGIRQSRGAYLVFLDADDRLLPDALRTSVRFLTEHPDCAFVTGQVTLIDRNGTPLETPSQPTIEKDHYKTLLRSNYIWTPGVVMYRRTVFQTHQAFDPQAGGSADYELNIRIARTLAVGCHGQVVLEYRQHSANMSSNLAYMLKSGVEVRRAEYRYVRHQADLRRAWRAGIRIVQDDVGERLVKEAAASLQTPAGRKTIPIYLWHLLHYYPKGLILFYTQSLKYKVRHSLKRLSNS